MECNNFIVLLGKTSDKMENANHLFDKCFKLPPTPLTMVCLQIERLLHISLKLVLLLIVGEMIPIHLL